MGRKVEYLNKVVYMIAYWYYIVMRLHCFGI